MPNLAQSLELIMYLKQRFIDKKCNECKKKGLCDYLYNETDEELCSFIKEMFDEGI